MNRSGKLPPPSGDAWEDARRELRWAFAGAGLTPDKLASMPAVMALPVVRAAVAGGPADRRLVTACETVADAARGLGDGIHARVLRSSLAVDYNGTAKDLTARRDEVIRQHNESVRAAGRNDYLGESPRAVFDIENKMLSTLLTVLGASPPGSTPAGDDAAAAAPAGDLGGPAPGGWGLAHQEITYRLSGRSGREAEAVYVVRALEDGLDRCDLTYYCSREGGRPSTLVLLDGGEVVHDSEVGRSNFRIATARFTPLARGETRRLRFDVRYPGGGSEDADPFVIVQVVRPTEHLVLRLTFDRPELPAKAWRVDGVHPEAHAGDPDASVPLVVDEFGAVEAEWDRPRTSFAYGIGWAWPPRQ
jgi:hypothetical protein